MLRVVLPLFLGELLAAGAAPGHGYRSSRPWLPRESAVGSSVPSDQVVSESELPAAFDWRDVNGRSFVVSDVNQHIPVYCGACWIHGTIAALNDRIKAMRNARFPDVMLGRQAIMNCVPSPDGKGPPPGCDGGDTWMIHHYMHGHKVPDESCMPYQARNMECVPENVCRNCFPAEAVEKGLTDKQCFPVEHWTGYGVSSYGNLSGEVAMMKEVYARGPIACSAATDLEFMLNYSENAARNEGVYVTDTQYNESQIDHVLEVAGWGTTPAGIKYWIIRNSWGTYWGDLGWMKLRRGVNQQLIESDCDWAVPDYQDLDNAMTGHALGDYVRGAGLVAVAAFGAPSSTRPVPTRTTAQAAALRARSEGLAVALQPAAPWAALLAGAAAAAVWALTRARAAWRQPAALG